MSETRAERRERIAVQLQAGMLACTETDCDDATLAECAVNLANALMAELDKRAAEDAQETEAKPITAADPLVFDWRNAAVEANCERLHRAVDQFFQSDAEARRKEIETDTDPFREELVTQRNQNRKLRNECFERDLVISDLKHEIASLKAQLEAKP